MKQFLHIAFNWSDSPPDPTKSLKEYLEYNARPTPPSPEDLEPTFSKAIDWIRYAPNCWIVWTSTSPEKWYARLKPFLRGKDHVFICKLDISVRYGYLPKWIWGWIKEKSSEPES
jgi:hypothetical protein